MGHLLTQPIHLYYHLPAKATTNELHDQSHHHLVILCHPLDILAPISATKLYFHPPSYLTI